MQKLTEGRINSFSLNEPQQEAVEHTDGPLLILAGAGSGKTRVLAAKSAYLVHNGYAKPYQILALTFTNKAARELRDRAAASVGPEGSALAAGTFHSIFARLMRQAGRNIDLDPQFTIVDTDDRRKLIRAILKEKGLSGSDVRPAQIEWMISGAKNNLIDPQEYQSFATKPIQRTAAEVYRTYEKRMRQMNGLDFDDLLLRPLQAFREFPDFLERLQERFRYVMVDEFQDTNRVQYLLVQQIALQHRNLSVVGDDDQAIYGWRGASIRNILDFKKDWQDATVIRLEQNYRSTKPILETAWSVISRNEDRHPKKLWTEKPGGDRIDLYKSLDGDEEAMRFAGIVQDLHKTHNMPYNHFAILYRTNAQSLPFERALRSAQIPYHVVGGLRFYERKEIKDVLAYLRVIVNPSDDVSLLRIINYPPRGIGQQLIDDLNSEVRQRGISMGEAIAAALNGDELNTRRRNALKAFVELLQQLKKTMREETIYETAVETVRLTNLKDRLAEEEKDDPTKAESKRANVDYLLQDIYRFSEDRPEATINDFLEEVTLVTDADDLDEEIVRVNLMTLHSAKGLEFPTVFIGGLEEGILPLQPPDNNDMNVAEERRLFYVGITRAKERLVLGYAENRLRFGLVQWNRPSRFIDDLPQEHVVQNGKAVKKRRAVRNVSSRSELVPLQARPRRGRGPNSAGKIFLDADGLRKGLLVRHRKFGLGLILDFDRRGLDTKVRVDFDDFGIKTLVLRYARLESAK